MITLILLAFSCQIKTETSLHEKLKIEKHNQNKFEIENRKFSIGDVNNDKIKDTAFVSLKRNIESGEIECENINCFTNIEFNQKIPKISFNQSLGLYVIKSEDLNNDKANEIKVFSRTNEGWWNYISVLSFNGKKWIELAKTKGFCTEDKDFENRIINEKGNFYLIGDNQWEQTENGNFKKIKTKI